MKKIHSMELLQARSKTISFEYLPQAGFFIEAGNALGSCLRPMTIALK